MPQPIALLSIGLFLTLARALPQQLSQRPSTSSVKKKTDGVARQSIAWAERNKYIVAGVIILAGLLVGLLLWKKFVINRAVKPVKDQSAKQINAMKQDHEDEIAAEQAKAAQKADATMLGVMKAFVTTGGRQPYA